ncbi:MAG: type I-E CRISPR-associated protein Cas6/Cse3/CasE [Candidatus Methylumidiphilus sp.]
MPSNLPATKPKSRNPNSPLNALSLSKIYWTRTFGRIDGPSLLAACFRWLASDEYGKKGIGPAKAFGCGLLLVRRA